MFGNNRILFILLLAIVCLVSRACDTSEVVNLGEMDYCWKKQVAITGYFEVQQIVKLGNGIENNYQGISAQGVMVNDNVMYRLYDSGFCQTFDISDLQRPVKISSFALGSRNTSNHNHANCAQGYVDENGDLLMYVSGLNGGKAYVERITKTGATLIQTITLSRMDILDKIVALNAVCSDDGDLWYFGSGGDKLLFARAHRPSPSEGDVTIDDSDISDYWTEDGYVYDDDVWQGGKVYHGLLFMLFGTRNCKRHLAIYDTRSHMRIMDIDFSDTIPEEPEDCEVIPEGILIVTNGGNHFYLIQPK